MGTTVQTVLMLLVLAGLFIGTLSTVMFWAGLSVERFMLVSFGVAGAATGIQCIGEALMPRWPRAFWKPPPGGRATVRLGRLSSLGAGLWFTAGGLAFLGYGWLTENMAPVILGGFAAGMFFTLVGMSRDRRRAEAARTAVRRHGWSTTSRREVDALPADDAQLRQDAREALRLSIQENVAGRTTMEQVESQGKPGPAAGEEWLAFRSSFAEGDQIWKFNTVTVRRGVASGERGLAQVRCGMVVDWFITATVGP